jgi:copper chaperone
MEKRDFTIPNITCGHCVAAIKDELSEMNGVSAVDGNPESKVMQVAWEAPATLALIREKLQEINYPAE